MVVKRNRNLLYDVLRAPAHPYRPEELAKLFAFVQKEQVDKLAGILANYIKTNLPEAIEKREGLADYRTNPYVTLTAANVTRLSDPDRFAKFLFDSKLYAGLETSFGKSIEDVVIGTYPLVGTNKWVAPPEKIAEAKSLSGLSREEKARKRRTSIWREIDKSCVLGTRRILMLIKSGPNCINDTQVQAMTDAITDNYRKWLAHTKKTYPTVTGLDIVIGLTYGTERTTNNKENQILVKLLESGFVEENRASHPGVLVAKGRNPVRVYRCVGSGFWAVIGNPKAPRKAEFTFLEVLLGLAKALKVTVEHAEMETRINLKLKQLALALSDMTLPENALPKWVGTSFSDSEMFWLATALSAFYDLGI
jgi:hypothetical protein